MHIMNIKQETSMNKKKIASFALIPFLFLTSCKKEEIPVQEAEKPKEETAETQPAVEEVKEEETTSVFEVSDVKTVYTDENGDTAYIPAQFAVSEKEGEHTINTGLVVIGPDGSEYVWIPTTVTPLEERDFGIYFSQSGVGSLQGYYDEEDSSEHQEMVESVNEHGGFYIARYEASRGEDGIPMSVSVEGNDPYSIWVRFSPADTQEACERLYADNDTVAGFFPWGCTFDTVLQWLVDSGNKSWDDVASNSTSWGNYTNDDFSPSAFGDSTGIWTEASANNIYDLAGNNWEWTQERYGQGNYVMRSGGYNLMGGPCNGDRYPAAIRDPLPGNDHHPNVVFRSALYLK